MVVMKTMEQRLERLESQVRWWRVICIGAVVCAAGAWVMGGGTRGAKAAAGDEAKPTADIVARSITVGDINGNPGFRVEPGKLGCTLSIGTGDGGRIEMYPDTDGGRIRIIGKDNRMRVQIIGSDLGGSVFVHDAKGDTVLNLPEAKK
jgi:hypothetical protein